MHRPTPIDDTAPVNSDLDRSFVITGGAGFLGANLADALLSAGATVTLFDNLSKPYSGDNCQWLQDKHGPRVRVELGDIRDAGAVARAVGACAGVFHLAAQISIERSLEDPTYDFEVNVGGTLNVLEALRHHAGRPFLVYTSTNKVYGALPDVPIGEAAGRYQPMDQLTRARGISETRRLEFTSPHACSKGAADQYVLDYARTYGVPAAVFRLGSIYGPRQHGGTDQGWVSHFITQTMAQRPITICGDGKQVRDLLYIDDLVSALVLAARDIGRLRGRVFNLGGGPQNAASILEVLAAVEEIYGRRPELRFCDWRVGDQRYYVSDNRAFKLATGWEPHIGVQTGVARLFRWMLEAAGKPARSDAPSLDGETTTLKRAAP